MSDDFERALGMDRAHVVVEGASGLTTDKVLDVFWEGIADSRLAAAALWEQANRHTLSSPKIENQEFTGVWRAGPVSIKDNVLHHKFFFGYIETLLNGGALVWTEARVTQGREVSAGAGIAGDNPGANTVEKWYSFYWPNCSPFKAEAIKAEIAALAVSGFNPVVNGETYPTGLHRLYVVSKIEEDESATITLFLGSPEFRLNGVDSRLIRKSENVEYHWNVPKELAQPLMDAATGRGTTTRPAYNRELGVVDIIIYKRNFTGGWMADFLTGSSCSSMTYESLYLAQTYPLLYTIPTSSTMGYTYSRDIIASDDDTYITTIRTRVTQPRNFPEAVVGNGPITKVLETIQTGMQVASYPDITTSVDGIVYSQDISVADDCSKSYTTRKELAVPKVVNFLNNAETTLSLEGSYEYANLYVPFAAPVNIQGEVWEARFGINRFGIYDGRLVKHESKSASFKTETTGTLAIDSGYEYLNRDGLPSGFDTATIGYRIEQKFTLNQDGTYSGRAAVRKSVAANYKTIVNNPLSSRTSYGYENSDLPAAKTAGRGSQIEQAFSINQDGTYNGRESVETGIETIVPFIKTVDSTLSTSGAYDYSNVYNPLDAPNDEIGKVWNARFKLNTLGLYDGFFEKRESTPAKFKTETVGTLAIDAGYEYVNQTALPDGFDTAAIRYRIERNFALNNDGTYSGRAVVRKSVAADFKTIVNNPLSSTTSYGYENYDLPSGGMTVGRGSRAERKFTLNLDGTYNGVEAVETGTAIIVPFKTTFDSTLSTSGVYDYDNLYDPMDASGDEIGVTWGARFRLNKLGLYDGSLEKTLSVEKSFTTSFTDSSGPVTIYDYVNLRSIPTAALATIDYQKRASVDFDMNRDGTYNGTVTILNGKLSISTSDDTDNSRYYLKEFTNDAKTEWRYIVIQIFYTTSPTLRDTFLIGGDVGRDKMDLLTNWSVIPYAGGHHSHFSEGTRYYACERVSILAPVVDTTPDVPWT